ncbi:hypothetical protein D1AOALGA4SA_11775 [Olavius algarvensis Delta 1 endosymbiont]|nr:hypothetical protein D1AOALGA4SA_11775 [Olavius algarvensis Delta 1 endosymbiont]
MIFIDPGSVCNRQKSFIIRALILSELTKKENNMRSIN